MNRRSAFTGEWMSHLGVVAFNLAVRTPILRRASGWSGMATLGLLTLLTIALALLCGLIAERDPQKAYVLSNVFLLGPAITALLLLCWMVGVIAWHKFT